LIGRPTIFWDIAKGSGDWNILEKSARSQDSMAVPAGIILVPKILASEFSMPFE
jgi:hypothetical protein